LHLSVSHDVEFAPFVLFSQNGELLTFLISCFVIIGYIYPALLTALVPVRSYILSALFKDEDLKYLDPTDESEEEYIEEKRKIRMKREDSFSSVGSHLPHFGDFHPDALRKTLKKRKNAKDIEEIKSVPDDVVV